MACVSGDQLHKELACFVGHRDITLVQSLLQLPFACCVHQLILTSRLTSFDTVLHLG